MTLIRTTYALLVIAIAAILPTSSTPALAQRSSDWELVDKSGTNYYLSHRNRKNVVAAADAAHYIVLGAGGIPHEILQHSSDSGRTWREVRRDAYPMQYRDLAYPVAGTIVIAADSLARDGQTLMRGFLFRSADDGLTWDTTMFPAGTTVDMLAMASATDGVASHVGTSPTMLRTTDGWRTWSAIPLAPGTTRIINLSAPAPGIYIVNGRHRTLDGGGTWTSSATGPPAGIGRIRFETADVGWGAGGRSNGLGDQLRDVIAKTTDGGMTWTDVIDRQNHGPWGLLDIDFADATHGIAVGKAKKVLTTTNGGVTWRQDNVPYAIHQYNGLTYLAYPAPGSAVSVGDGARVRYAGRDRLAAPQFIGGNRGDESDTPTISWTAITGATTYQLQQALDWDFAPPQIDVANLTTNAQQLSLDFGRQYYFRVRAIANGDTSQWSDYAYIVTRSSPSALTAPVYVAPAMEATGLPRDVLAIWRSTPGATRYHLQVADLPIIPGTQLLVDDQNVTDTVYMLRDLEPGRTYFLRLKAIGIAGESKWTTEVGPALHFTIGGPMSTPDSRMARRSLAVYPNPATKVLVVEVTGRIARLRLVDALGRTHTPQITSRATRDGTTHIRLALDDVPSGRYLLEVTTEAGTFVDQVSVR